MCLSYLKMTQGTSSIVLEEAPLRRCCLKEARYYRSRLGTIRIRSIPQTPTWAMHGPVSLSLLNKWRGRIRERYLCCMLKVNFRARGSVVQKKRPPSTTRRFPPRFPTPLLSLDDSAIDWGDFNLRNERTNEPYGWVSLGLGHAMGGGRYFCSLHLSLTSQPYKTSSSGTYYYYYSILGSISIVTRRNPDSLETWLKEKKGEGRKSKNGDLKRTPLPRERKKHLLSINFRTRQKALHSEFVNEKSQLWLEHL